MGEKTPTNGRGCKLRIADFSTLVEALDYAATGNSGANFYSGRGELLEVLTYRDLREDVVRLARRMKRAGLMDGERVALVAETDADFLRSFFACQYAGLVPVPLPLPAAFGGRVGYVEHIRRMLEVSGASAALSPASVLDMIEQAAETLHLKAVGTLALFDSIPEDGADLTPVGENNLSYLQFSSGSTRFPVGVAVTQRAVLANTRSIARDGVDANEQDRCTSWLPFYHDMGLVGLLLTPVVTQMSVDYVATREFARRPLIWPSLISQNGGTLSYSPSFGYDLCVRRAAKASTEKFDLSTWRVAGIGGDMIRPAALSQFAEVFQDCGFRKESFVASYGMAEATLAISFAPRDRGIEIDHVDLDLLEEAGRAEPMPMDGADGTGRMRDFVLCGKVLPDHDLEIRDLDGNALPDREVGRVLVRGPSLMQEYFGNRDETARVMLTDGWLDTGDLGYLLQGELVITGRSKDLILVNGRNVWPQDIEWTVEHAVGGLRSGDVAAFSLDAEEKERVILLVQCRTSLKEARENLRRTVVETVREAAGFDCEAVLVPPNTLPRTSSGKLSRAGARQMYLTAAFGEDRTERFISRQTSDASAVELQPL